MLQKSKSKTIAKFKYLILVPLMLVMLTYVACSQDTVVPQEEQEATNKEKLEEIIAILNDGTEITAEERAKIEAFIEANGTPDMGTSKNISSIDQTNQKEEGVPFSVLEQVPVFPGCEDLVTNEERKKCFTDQLTKFVNINFDSTLGKENGLVGINRVYVQFKINKDGSVDVMGARAPHPALKEEAIRVVNMLPDMVPGKHGGEEVAVLYSLPITFKIGE